MTDTQESPETHEPIEIEIPAGGNRLGLILASGMGIVLVALIAVLATSETNQGLGPSPLITQADIENEITRLEGGVATG